MFKANYPEDSFRAGRAAVLMPFVPSTVFMLRWINRTRYFSPRSRGFTLSDLVNEGIYSAMPRTRKTPTKPAANAASGKQAGVEKSISWLNIPLSDDDITTLEQSPATYETVAASLLSLADDGFDFSIKPVDGGKSIMAAVYGYADGDTTRKMGVSAFAENSRDASLACLYKFEELLGGSFPSGHVDTARPKSRFR
jgi:hypothetical protein